MSDSVVVHQDYLIFVTISYSQDKIDQLYLNLAQNFIGYSAVKFVQIMANPFKKEMLLKRLLIVMKFRSVQSISYKILPHQY